MKTSKSKTIIAITFILIVATGTAFKQQFIRMVPLIISIGVMLLSSEANRYAYLVGGLNSIIYAFAECSYIGIISGAIAIVMNIQVMLNTPAHITYFIFSLCMWATVAAYFNIQKLYKAQIKEKYGEKQYEQTSYVL